MFTTCGKQRAIFHRSGCSHKSSSFLFCYHSSDLEVTSGGWFTQRGREREERKKLELHMFLRRIFEILSRIWLKDYYQTISILRENIYEKEN